MQKDKGRVGLCIDVILFESRVVNLEVLGFLLSWIRPKTRTFWASMLVVASRHAIDKFESYCLLFKICLCFRKPEAYKADEVEPSMTL